MNSCPRFLFTSLSDRPHFSQPMFDTLTEYCHKHGYLCELETKTLCPDRAPAWSKILLVQREMVAHPDVPFVVWVDDDILLTDLEHRFDDFVDGICFGHILLSDDMHPDHPFNSGLFVARNTVETWNYLQEIWYFGGTQPDCMWGQLWEQTAMLRHTLAAGDISYLTIVPHNILQSFYCKDYDDPNTQMTGRVWEQGDFAVHFTGMQMSDRIQARDMIIAKLGKNFS